MAKPGRLDRLAAGARSGLSATATMSAAMAAFDALGWFGQPPPRQLVERLAPDKTPDRVIDLLATGAHFGYGAMAGSAYRLLRRSPGAGSGMIFGLAVLVVSYEGWLPMFGIRAPLHRDDPREIAGLVVAHLVYGASLGRRLAKQS
jgi:hypothetical protein